MEAITEERARRALEKIDLLNKIREEILTHPELEDRLQLCKPSMDLPEWWICGKHDKELLMGAAKYVGIYGLPVLAIDSYNVLYSSVIGMVLGGWIII